MKHSHIALIGEFCMICKRPAVDHGPAAQCESCPNIGPCELIDDILMCESCQARDIEVKSEVSQAKPSNGESEYPLSWELRAILDKAGITSNDKRKHISEIAKMFESSIPKNNKHYHVNTAMAISDMQDRLAAEIEDEQARHFALAQLVEERLMRMRQNLFDLKNLELECKTDMVADQIYLNNLVPRLRAEEREKFKAYDISYKPAIAPISIPMPKPRVSAADRALENAAKMFGLTVEQYKHAFQSAMSSISGATCTCQVTPGICKVHNP